MPHSWFRNISGNLRSARNRAWCPKSPLRLLFHCRWVRYIIRYNRKVCFVCIWMCLFVCVVTGWPAYTAWYGSWDQKSDIGRPDCGGGAGESHEGNRVCCFWGWYLQGKGLILPLISSLRSAHIIASAAGASAHLHGTISQILQPGCEGSQSCLLRFITQHWGLRIICIFILGS